jgi:hypothetical protein
MKNQIEIVKDIANGMIGIGGIPSNEEFYAEFDMRVRAALRIHDVVGRSEQLVCDVCEKIKGQEYYTICHDCHIDSIQ